MPSPVRLIVAAGLIEDPQTSTFLLSRRGADTHLAHSWEFPGGKLNPGESPTECVRRELKEELGIDVSVGQVFAVGHHVYPEREVILLVYHCLIESGEPQCLEVAEYRWVTAQELVEMELPPADLPVIDRIRREYL